MNDSNFLKGMIATLLIFGFIEMMAWMEGSTRDDIRIEHITQAFGVCKDNDGLLKIEGESIGGHKFICNNGAVFIYRPPKKENK